MLERQRWAVPDCWDWKGVGGGELAAARKAPSIFGRLRGKPRALEKLPAVVREDCLELLGDRLQRVASFASAEGGARSGRLEGMLLTEG